MITIFTFTQILQLNMQVRIKHYNKHFVKKKHNSVPLNLIQKGHQLNQSVKSKKTSKPLPSAKSPQLVIKFRKKFTATTLRKPNVRVTGGVESTLSRPKDEIKIFRSRFIRKLKIKMLLRQVRKKLFSLKADRYNLVSWRNPPKFIFNFFKRNIRVRSKRKYAFRLFYLFCKVNSFDRKINPSYDKDLEDILDQPRKHKLPEAYLFKYKKVAYKFSKLWLNKYFTKPGFRNFLYRIGRNPWWKKGFAYRRRTLKVLKKFEKVVSRTFPVKTSRFHKGFKYVSHRQFTAAGIGKPNLIQFSTGSASKIISPFKLLIHRFPASTSLLLDSKKLVSESFIRSRGYFLYNLGITKRRSVFTNSVRRFPRAQLKRVKFNFNSPIYFKRHSKSLLVATKLISRRRRLRYRLKVSKPYRYLFNKVRFTFGNLPERPTRSLRAAKKSVRFYPFLGLFSKYGRTTYKLRRRRIKFYKFFRKYFRTYDRFFGTQTRRYRHIRTRASKIKFFLHIFKSINNIFVNISASRGRSIFVYSAGRTQYKGSKRLSPIALETMGRNVSGILKSNRIGKIFVVFHSPIDYLSRALLRGLRSNVLFSGFQYYLNKPHNGLRKRASRRV
jgi:ribosomal protein S11